MPLRRTAAVLVLLGMGCGPREDGGGFAAPELAMDAGLVHPTVEFSEVLVGRVLDGDTVTLVAPSGSLAPDQQPLNEARVRFIGVDTPELGHGDPSDCFAEEARTFTRDRIEGRVVRIEFDYSGGLRDPFGRILAYVVYDGEVLNEALAVDELSKDTCVAASDERLVE
ncbi:MAG: thermonuclease family protein, partial [Myxococcota bacterium]